MLWALGRAEDEMRWPRALCKPQELADAMFAAGPRLVGEAALRPAAEIVDAADFVYRLHWVVRDNWLHKLPAVDGVQAGSVQERHRALNWLVGYGEEWDDVSTDT